jgi:uncharacterized iron-regulated membrane protein
MRAFRLLWLLHRWLGIGAGIVLLLSATTGFLLLVKKDFAWLWPKWQHRRAAAARATAGNRATPGPNARN